MLNNLSKQQNWSFHEENSHLTARNQAKIDLEENVMIKEKLSSNFKKQIWSRIQKIKPVQFIYQQNSILQFLIQCKDSFNQHFKRFYNNHLKFYQWYVLASQKHEEMKKYIFSQLLKKSFQEYKFILKENLIKNSKNQTIKQSLLAIPQTYCLRSINGSPKKKFIFPQNQIKNSQSMPTSIHQSAYFPSCIEKNQQQDYHQLFVRTLDACDGSKYIYYDFTKHQKGYQNRNLYNNFIRRKHRNVEIHSKNKTFYCKKSLRSGLIQLTRQNREQKLVNNTFSILKSNKQNKNTQSPLPQFNDNYSIFSISHFGEWTPNYAELKKRQNLRSKTSKNLVLKKMPHQFGKQKPFSDFAMKQQKPGIKT